MNFALSQMLGIFDDTVEAVMALQCPDDITGTAQSVCAVATNLVYGVMKAFAIIFGVVSG